MAQRITLDNPSVYQQLRHDSIGEAVLEVPPRQRRVPIIDVRSGPRPSRVRLSDLQASRPDMHRPSYSEGYRRYATATARHPAATKPRKQLVLFWTRIIGFKSQYLSRHKSRASRSDTKKLLDWYHSPVITKILIAMSIIIFVTGMTVSIRTFNLNNKAVSQIDALSQSTVSDPADDISGNNGEAGSAGSQSNWIPSEVPLNSEEINNYSVAAALPRVIAIPTIELRTIIKHAGVDSHGAVDVPRNVFVVNWYDQGAKPGDPAGAMLLTGHFSGPKGAGAFHDIGNLDNGDIIEIEQGDGTVFTFLVVEKITYELADTDMTQAITSADSSKLGLNLMTCDGRFDYDARTYDQRLLVRAVKV